MNKPQEESNYYSEGKAKFYVGKAFYNPESKVVRDLGILAANIYRQDFGRLKILDAMSGCGVRSLRYWLESGADWISVNEGNPELNSLLHHNLREAIAQNCCHITHQDAHRLFFDCYHRRDYYDLVDVDCFGSAAGYLSTMLWATKINGLMYLTSTDGRTATGHSTQNSLQAYGAYARSHPAAQEQALRLLIGSVQQQAATKGLGIEPIFSLFTGKTYRVMLRLVKQIQLTEHNYGFLGYCHHCGNYQTVSWRKLGKVACVHDERPLTISGAMWLGELHDLNNLRRMRSLAKLWKWQQVAGLIDIMTNEVNFPPYFYTLAEIGRRGKLDIPKRSQLIQALQANGYPAGVTHINAQAIKTDANINTCITLAHKLKCQN
ncbi:MAG: tRNA (guanine-N1)-methyltransferase [Xenococcaceae cyanobacterium MO_188.B32]|nr:tRNA (guanine-N1)-methyltransferase [Xenococcaceae cyanobacterium MO_188.B32]